MKNVYFQNGDAMPAIGLGTWKATGDEVKNAIKDAIHSGYRHIDTAAIYGNESEIGEALQELFQDGTVKRNELFITSKLWNDAHNPDDVLPALKESLKKLKLDYLDLYLIHWPVAFKSGSTIPDGPTDYVSLQELPLETTWSIMEDAQKLGLAKHIGVSNFSVKKLKDLISKSNRIPEVNQVEMHPLLQQEGLFDYCKKNNIILTAYSPLGSGDRAEQMKAADEPNLFELDTIREIAEKHKVHPAQVLIGWHVKRGVSVIPKSSTKSHIESNLKSENIEFDKDDLKAILALDENYRFITGKFWDCPEKGYTNVYDE